MLIVFMIDFFESVNFEKKPADNNKSMKNHPAGKELNMGPFTGLDKQHFECNIINISISLNIGFGCSKEPSH